MIFKSNLFYPALVVLLLIFVFFVSFNGLYGQDAYEYFRYAKSLHDYFLTGKNPGDYFWSYMYPGVGSIVAFVFPILFSLQLVSITALIISIYFTEKIILCFCSTKFKVRIYLLLFLFLSPFVLRSSLTVMSDNLCLCFVMGSFYFFIKHQSGKSVNFLFLVLFAFAAILTRYAAAVILILPVLFSLKHFLKNFNLPILIYSLLVVLILFIPYYLLKSENLNSAMQHDWLSSWNASNIFKRDFSTPEGLTSYTFPNFIYCFSNSFSPGYFFVGILVLFFISNQHFATLNIKVLSTSWILYSFFLGGIPYQNNRFLLLSFPLLIAILFPAALMCWKFVSEKLNFQKLLITLVCLTQLALFTRAFIPFYKYNKTEQYIISDMSKRMLFTVYTTEITAALRAYQVPYSVVDLWESKIKSVIKPALLLVNSEKIKRQWGGMNVMTNYNFIKEQNQLVFLKSFSGGWELYEIK